jgi:hypothetical protein
LSHGDVGREDVLDEMGGALGHAPAAAARAETAALAAERHEPLERAVGTPHPREAVRQHAAAEELSELAHDERGQPDAVGPVADVGGEVAPVPADDAVERPRRRGARDIDAAHGVRSQRMSGHAETTDFPTDGDSADHPPRNGVLRELQLAGRSDGTSSCRVTASESQSGRLDFALLHF